MNPKILHGVLALAFCATTYAADPAPAAPAPAIDLEARKASVINLQAQIEQREQRMSEVAQDIITLDARIEKRIDTLVKMLADTRDSQDSRTKVSRLKQDAIEGLKRAINQYVTKRKEMRERVRTGDDASLADLGKFDKHITKRVEQIVELSKSFPTHTDVAKYESGGGGAYWNGYYAENTRISEEWKQNRRDTTRANQTRDDTTAALRKVLERIDQRRRSVEDLLANRKLSESERKLYQEELGQADAYKEFLNSQLVEATTATGSGASRQPGLDEAIDLEELFTDARKDLRDDFAKLFRLYDDFARGRAKTEALKENLAARKAWLEKNAPAGK